MTNQPTIETEIIGPFKSPAQAKDRPTVTDEAVEKLAKQLFDNEVHCCQSSLVDMLLKTEEIANTIIVGFSYDDITELYPDPSDWDVDECRKYLDDDEYVCPDDDASVEFWRLAVTNNAKPAEILEWWLVTIDLARNLSEIDEPILDNDYGTWWGRTCSGQSVLQDGTLQKVARMLLER